MYYITNGKVCWHIENQIGDWLEQGVFCLSHDGWKLIKAGNLSITRGWIVGAACGEITPKTKKAKAELESYLRRTIDGKTNRSPKA